jgi:hypothetical protein
MEWTIAADGSQAAKLEISDDFSPMGFTADGDKLYGAWKVNKQRQLAIFSLQDHKASTVPSTVVLLPRGIGSAEASPDGKRFAIVADPRPADGLEDVRHVAEPPQSSLYVVNADGTMGAWWCSGLKSIEGEPVWNADGSSLVCSRCRRTSDFHRCISKPGRTRVRTSAPFCFSPCVWSHHHRCNRTEPPW